MMINILKFTGTQRDLQSFQSEISMTFGLGMYDKIEEDILYTASYTPSDEEQVIEMSKRYNLKRVY